MNCKPLHNIISHSIISQRNSLYRFWSICFLALTRHSVRFLAVRVSCVFIVIADAYISGIIQIYNVIAIFNTQRNRYYSVYVVILVRFHFPFITGSFDQKRIVEKPLIEKYQYATFSLCVFFDKKLIWFMIKR